MQPQPFVDACGYCKIVEPLGANDAKKIVNPAVTPDTHVELSAQYEEFEWRRSHFQRCAMEIILKSN